MMAPQLHQSKTTPQETLLMLAPKLFLLCAVLLMGIAMTVVSNTPAITKRTMATGSGRNASAKQYMYDVESEAPPLVPASYFYNDELTNSDPIYQDAFDDDAWWNNGEEEEEGGLEVQVEEDVTNNEEDDAILEHEAKEMAHAAQKLTAKPWDPSLPSPDVVNEALIINGVSYSLDLVNGQGQPNLDLKNAADEKKAQELAALLPLPKPVLVVGMMKAGTTSVAKFFKKSNKYKLVSHWSCGKKIGLCGRCMKNAIKAGLPPLKKCGNYDVFAQMDAMKLTTKGGHAYCDIPQIQYLEELHNEAPHATILLNRRHYEHWFQSMLKWSSAHKRLFKYCKPFGPTSDSQEDVIAWHKEQVMRIRQFVLDHPSHALLEVDIEHPSSALRMAKAFNESSHFWGHVNSNPKNRRHYFLL